LRRSIFGLRARYKRDNPRLVLLRTLWWRAFVVWLICAAAASNRETFGPASVQRVRHDSHRPARLDGSRLKSEVDACEKASISRYIIYWTAAGHSPRHRPAGHRESKHAISNGCDEVASGARPENWYGSARGSGRRRACRWTQRSSHRRRPGCWGWRDASSKTADALAQLVFHHIR